MPHLSPVGCLLELLGAPPVAGLDPEWRVLRADVSQRIDHPWLAVLAIVTDTVETSVEELLGRPAMLTWVRASLDAGPQVLRGLVTRAEYVGTFDRQLHARIRLEPALALLRHGRRRRIFEQRPPHEIARDVLEPVFSQHDATLLTDALTRVHDLRDYVVQYDETDLDFLRRLLAMAGIAFMFDPSLDVDHVRLVDHNDGFLAVGHGHWPNGLPNPPEIRVISTRPEEATEESVQSFSASHEVTTARVTTSSWDFKHRDPTRLRSSAATGARAASGESLEHTGVRLVELDEGNGPTDDPTPWMSQHAAERVALEAAELGGRGIVTLFSAGTVFKLSDHPHDELDAATYLLTRVTHRIEIPSAAVSGAGRGSTYQNEFTCVPFDRPYRPARLAGPHVHGPETAIVLGPRNEEVHTDRHGRIHVRLHWDERDPESCQCWLRVSQAWAGLGFGTLFLPRVGMEVVVSFLDGNPDRPIVTGCVYNALNVPPVELPEHKTQSTIRTSSSPGGRGHNELRFEDGADREEVYLRAQRNLREWVGSEHRTTVGSDQTLHVGHDQTVTIAGDRKSTIDGTHEHVVGGDERYLVKGFVHHEVSQGEIKSIGKAWSLLVNMAGKRSPGMRPVDGGWIYVDGDSFIEATREQILACGDSRIAIHPRRIDVEAPEVIRLAVGGTSVVLTARDLRAFAASIGLSVSGAPMSGPGETELVLAPDHAALTSTTRVSVKGGSAETVLDGNVTINGDTTTIHALTLAEMTAPETSIEATTEARLCGGGGIVRCASAAVEVNGG